MQGDHYQQRNKGHMNQMDNNQQPRQMNQNLQGNAMPQAQQMPPAMNASSGPAMMPAPQMNMNTKDETSQSYLAKTMPILPAILAENPSYQQHVGSCIFPFVQQVCGPDLAPKITGMLIDLPIAEIHAFMKDYKVMCERIRQA